MITSKSLDIIRAAIESRGWTAAELQRQAGISYRAAWTIMHGDCKRLGLDTLDAVLVALRLRIARKR